MKACVYVLMAVLVGIFGISFAWGRIENGLAERASVAAKKPYAVGSPMTSKWGQSAQSEQAAQKAMGTSENLTGESIQFDTAVRQTDMIIVGKLTDIGTPQPGAPGESYFENAKIEILRVLKGGMTGTPSLSLSFTVQKISPTTAEEAPKIGREYLFFIKEPNKRAIKISAATEEHLSMVANLISMLRDKRGK